MDSSAIKDVKCVECTTPLCMPYLIYLYGNAKVIICPDCHNTGVWGRHGTCYVCNKPLSGAAHTTNAHQNYYNVFCSHTCKNMLIPQHFGYATAKAPTINIHNYNAQVCLVCGAATVESEMCNACISKL